MKAEELEAACRAEAEQLYEGLPRTPGMVQVRYIEGRLRLWVEGLIGPLEDALRVMLASATPNERDHPAMSAAWRHAQEALSGQGAPTREASEEPCPSCGAVNCNGGAH